MRHSKSHFLQLLVLMSFRDVPSQWEPVTGVMKYDKWGKGRFIRDGQTRERMAQVCAIRLSGLPMDYQYRTGELKITGKADFLMTNA